MTATCGVCGHPLTPLRPDDLHAWEQRGKVFINPETGLTPEEDRISKLAAALWAAWLALPVQHPDDIGDVCSAVHLVQNLLCTRIARRAFPSGWTDHGAARTAGRE